MDHPEQPSLPRVVDVDVGREEVLRGDLRVVRASVAAASFYLIPVFGVALGWLVGERLEPVQWLGAVVVVAAVILITTRRSPAAAMSEVRAGAA